MKHLLRALALLALISTAADGQGFNGSGGFNNGGGGGGGGPALPVSVANGGTGTGTAPSSGQIPIGNAGGTAYAPQTMSGDATLANGGGITFATVNSNVGTFQGITFNGKGLATAAAPGQVSVGSNPYTQIEPNNSTGTGTGLLAKLTSTGAQTIGIGDTAIANLLGVCVSGCTTTGNATVAVGGVAQCAFDGATTSGDFVVASTSSAGKCSDAGATVPTGVNVIGFIESTNGGAGTYAVDINPVGQTAANAGNGNGNGGKNTGTSYLFSGKTTASCASVLGFIVRTTNTVDLCLNNVADQNYWEFTQTTFKNQTNAAQIILNAGSVTAPSFAVSNVSNTGIYAPSGGGAMFVTAAGNLSVQITDGQVAGSPSLLSGSVAVGTGIGLGGFYSDVISAGNGTNNAPGYSAETFSTTGGGGQVALAHSRNTTVGSHTALTAGDFEGNYAFFGSDGTGFIESGYVAAQVEGTVATGKVGARVTINTAVPGTGTVTEGFRVNSAQHISYGAGSAPTVSACGSTPSGSADAHATDNSGQITIGGSAATGCTITFGTQYVTYVHCRVTPETGTAIGSYSYTTSAITLTSVTAGDKYDYDCDGV